MAASVPLLLDLNRVVERPRIAIDGQLYDLPSPDELSIVDRYRLTSKCRRFDQLMAKEHLDEVEESDLVSQLRDASDIVLRHVPGKVRGQLSDAQRQQVLDCFSMLSLRNRMQIAAAAADKSQTWVNSSQGSRGSTEATRNGG